MNPRHLPLLCGLASLLLATSGCAAITGGAKKDSVEAAREQEAAASSEASPDAAPDLGVSAPPLAVTSDDFDASPAKPDDVTDFLAEAAVLALLAGAATGFVHLYQRRLPLLAFLVSMAALTVAGLAFLNSAT